MSGSKAKLIIAGVAVCGLLITSCTKWLRGGGRADPEAAISATDSRIALSGRTVSLIGGGVRFGYPGVRFSLRVKSTSLRMVAQSSSGDNFLDVQIDGQPTQTLRLNNKLESYTLFSANKSVEHTVVITHRNETWQGLVTVAGFDVDDGELLAVKLPDRRLLIIGDSVTCGEAVVRTDDCAKSANWWNATGSYGLLLAESLDAEAQLVCYGGRGVMRSWNGSTSDLQGPDYFELAIAEPDRQHRWDHTRYRPQLILISLGTNDFSESAGPMPEREKFVTAYVRFVNRLLSVYPEAQLALTEGAILNNDNPSRPAKRILQSYLQEVISRVRSQRVHYLPATHYPGDKRDAHPTGEQHKAMAEELAVQVRGLMGW